MESTFLQKMSYIGVFFVTLLLNYVHDKCVFPYASVTSPDITF